MIQVGFKSDKGLRRTNNEDAYFVVPSDNIYMVADGVGGNNAGEIASRTAVSVIAEYIRENPVTDKKTEAELKEYFMQCLVKANTEIYGMARRHQENRGMATTIILVYVAGKQAYVVNVGDSRMYVCRNGLMSCITEDHTYVTELLKQGLITAQQAKNHPQRNMITRAIGGDATVQPDFFRVELEEGDVLMLCTDGLYDEVEESKMAGIIGESESMSDACRCLVNAANRSGGRDNITVVCLKI